ncbi:high-affinity choline transporter 1-like [Ornithodoros turicata]|uniref:high-affinity choline transporter 1-like n=1 Tax=Ornithodoros turicata TaxID=34597 RepID=UPI00313A1E5D
MNGARSMGMFVGIFTIIATWVDGGQLNGTAEVIAKSGFIWCQAPLGYAVSLLFGGFLFAGRMWRAGYVTMLDPLHEAFGDVMVALLFLPALLGEIFWVGAIMNALGATVSVMTGLHTTMAIIVSSVVAVLYTITGGLYSVAYTDIVELVCIFVGMWACIPFALTNEHVDPITSTSKDWIGTISAADVPSYIDNYLLFIFGGIPWQDYFQRVLSSKSVLRAQVLSYVGCLGTIIMTIPPVIIGMVARSARWNETDIDIDPLDESSLILPLVLQYLTPSYISFLGMGAVAAAVMSSADSCLLSCASMFTRNIYTTIIHKNASDRETTWVLRLTVIAVAMGSTALGITIDSVYALWTLSSDLVYVILFPQLVAVVYFRTYSNGWGSLAAYVTGFALRVLGGEPALSLPAVIKYPNYDEDSLAQRFPFKTMAMLASFVVLIAVSALTRNYEGPANCCACLSGSSVEVSNGDVRHFEEEEYSTPGAFKNRAFQKEE